LTVIGRTLLRARFGGFRVQCITSEVDGRIAKPPDGPW
jgi:hypothetical protein